MPTYRYKRPTYLPVLTEVEKAVFFQQEKEFFERYKLRHMFPIWRRIGGALQALACHRLIGIQGPKNKDEALQYYQRAVQFFPCVACSTPCTREMLGLPPADPCICNDNPPL